MVATELANITLGSNHWECKSAHPAPVTQPEACAAAVPGTAAVKPNKPAVAAGDADSWSMAR
jgi:hypothetical protein